MTRAYWEFLVHGDDYKPQSLARVGFSGFPVPLGRGKQLAEPLSVARVRPRTSKGITDLLLLNLAWLSATCPSKKLLFAGTL